MTGTGTTPNGDDTGAALTGRIRALLADVVGPDRAAVIGVDTDLVEEVMLDSIQMIAFLLRVEDDLDVEVDFESLGLDHVRTLRSFTRFLLAGATPSGERAMTVHLGTFDAERWWRPDDLATPPGRSRSRG